MDTCSPHAKEGLLFSSRFLCDLSLDRNRSKRARDQTEHARPEWSDSDPVPTEHHRSGDNVQMIRDMQLWYHWTSIPVCTVQSHGKAAKREIFIVLDVPCLPHF